jgi:hypothetical protein
MTATATLVERRPTDPREAATRPPTRPPGWPRPASTSLAAALYLALSVALWWHAWSISPSGEMTCDCTDAGRMVWYLQWYPFALGHGHALLHSTYQFHPAGFSLLTDTSIPALGILASPVTTVFGPVVAMNVISTLIPATTALTMYWFLRRWVQWAPAAFVGGLAYGFSAWVLVQLDFGWVNFSCAALLPLVAVVLDELLVRQRRRAVPVGLALGLLLVAEFFVSIEMALLIVIAIGVLLLLLVGWASVADRPALRRRWRHGAVGLSVGAAVAAVLLAYPVWLFLAGPGHLNGDLWSQNVPGSLGNTIGNLWDAIGHWGSLSSKLLVAFAYTGGGYTGAPVPAASFLGWGFFAVLVVGFVLWRKDRRLWVFAGLGGVLLALSLQVGPHHWGPWSVVYHVPVLLNVLQYRFAGIFVLCAAGMLGLILDHVHTSVLEALSAWTDRRRDGRTGSSRPRALAVVLAVITSAGVAAAALAPEVVALSPNLPAVMHKVTVPTWFTRTAPHLRPGTVLAAYPFPTAASQSAIPWQAIAGMPFQMAGGGGPPGTLERAGRDRPGFEVLLDASATGYPQPAFDSANLGAVRRAMRDWGVTTAVVPDGSGLAPQQVGRGATFGLVFYTSVFGRAPTRQDDAWVWTGLAHDASPPVSLSSDRVDDCLARSTTRHGADPWAACVLAPAMPA